MIILYMITPCLGLLRNYIKYKDMKPQMLVRTPIIYILINLLFQRNNVWRTLIFERWFFFIYKSILSIYKDDYINNKEKYIKKYNIKYIE